MNTQFYTMKKYFSTLLFTLFVILVSACGAPKDPAFIPANDPNIAYIGRVSFKNPESPAFTYPGVQIRAIFEGTSIAMKVKPHSGYFMVEVDKQAPYKVASLENDTIVALADSLAQGTHEIKITMAYEGREYRPEFRGFILDPGKKLPSTPILPTRKMEFIGNSITCGYGTEVTDPKAPFSYETENHYYTYAAATARAFDAQSVIVAKSGIGVYRNYGGPREGTPSTTMPGLYYQTQFEDSTETWDFSRYTPDIVCINLGTNDISMDDYDTGLLENGYRNFLKDLRGYYPKAKIVFLSGPMLHGKQLNDVQTAMNNVVNEAKAAGDNEVYRFDFIPTDGSLGYGASYHPSKAQQYKSASELIPFIQSLMGWDVVNPIE